MVPTSKLIVWTRARADWEADEQLFKEAQVDLQNVLRLPCIETQGIHIASLAPAVQKFANASQIIIISSLSSAKYAFHNPSTAALFSPLRPVHTHSAKAAAWLASQRVPLGGSFQKLVVHWHEEARTAKDLTEALLKMLTPGTRVLSIGAREPAFDMVEALTPRGLLVEHIASYATTSSLKTADGKSLTKEECDDLVTNPDLVLCFASPSAVRGFIDGLKAGSSRDEKSWVLKEKAQVVVIGPTTEDAARAHFNHITVSPWHEITALIQSVLAVRIS